MYILGTDKDYIMRASLSEFDNYGPLDLIGIEYDLSTLNERNHHLSPEELSNARCKYLQVISYIKQRVDTKNLSDEI